MRRRQLLLRCRHEWLYLLYRGERSMDEEWEGNKGEPEHNVLSYYEPFCYFGGSGSSDL